MSKEHVFKLISGLKDNSKEEVVFFKEGKRIVKKYSAVYSDVISFVSKVEHLINRELSSEAPFTILLCGPISYEWMIYDLGCILGGFRSIAIPETLSLAEFEEISNSYAFDLALIDGKLISYCELLEKNKVLVFNSKRNSSWPTFENIESGNKPNDFSVSRILDFYSIAFSSGTTSKPKPIKLNFIASEHKVETLSQFEKMRRRIRWSFIRTKYDVLFKIGYYKKKEGKANVLLFMPFSHLQQRGFVLHSLSLKTNVTLSDPNNCIKHIITEKPNVMVSVPIIYQVIALQIDRKLTKFSTHKKWIWKIYLALKINELSRYHFLHVHFQKYLFKDISKLYGGSADYFVTGSAAIQRSVLEIFSKVGVRIYEGYGQSELSHIISKNTTRKYKLGSVGVPNVDVEISSENEVLVKYQNKLGNKENFKVDAQGYIHTGDLGYLDKDGFLFITGRKDNVLVLENGKKVYPEKLENEFKSMSSCHECIVASADRVNVCLFVQDATLDESKIKEYIFRMNKNLQEHERIKRFSIRKQSFSVEEGTITANLKLKRKAAIMSFDTLEKFSLK